MNAVVVNRKFQRFDVYIGRPSKYGNPFVVGRDGNRKEVIWKYEHWLRQRITSNGVQWFRQWAFPLKGKRLGCYCKPQECHGDVLVKLMQEFNV